MIQKIGDFCRYLVRKNRTLKKKEKGKMFFYRPNILPLKKNPTAPKPKTDTIPTIA